MVFETNSSASPGHYDLESVLKSFHEGFHTFFRIFQSEIPSLSEFYL